MHNVAAYHCQLYTMQITVYLGIVNIGVEPKFRAIGTTGRFWRGKGKIFTS